MSNLFGAPMDHGPYSVQTGFDELGRPIYRTPLGSIVGEAIPEPPRQNALASILRTEVDPFTGRAIHRREDLQPTRTGNALASLLQGVTQGLTAPGRAARGQPVTLGDVWSTALDAGALATPMPAPRGAIRAGAMGTEGPADEIARMLREGRASEVTDDMMARLSPEDNVRLFRLYEEGATGQPMPMDEASRMARAREMGFDPDTALYHGTQSDFSELRPSERGLIGPGVYLTPDARLASRYGSAEMGRPGRVLDLIATNRPADADARTQAWLAARGAEDAARPGIYDRVFSERGFDGLSVEEQRTITDPRNIRSRFARFDPRLSHLAHLSAGGAGVAMLGGQEDQGGWDRARQYLREIGALE